MLSESNIYYLLAAEFCCIILGFIAFKIRAISISGYGALIAICTTFIFLGQGLWLFTLFFMFLSSSLLTRFKKEKKKEFEDVVEKTGPRDFYQAFANLGIAAACILLYYFFNDQLFLVALLSSVAAANADSWASEIGGLSKDQPILVTNFKPIEKGVSGGVTLLGTLGGIAGSGFIILSFQFISKLFGSFTFTKSQLCSAFMAGIFGFIFDSYLGATLQALYRNNVANRLTEQSIPSNKLIKGWRIINNDAVNFLTTLTSAIVGVLLYLLII